MFTAQDEYLRDLLDEVESNELQLPDFQRGWVWEDSRIIGLIASLTLGYPVGTIMLLNSGEHFKFKCRSLEGNGEAKKNPNRMLLDGQQRMTSTFLSLRSKNPVNTTTGTGRKIKRYYYINIEKALSTTIDREEAIFSVDENKQKKSDMGRVIDLNLSTEEKEFEQKMVPLNLCSNFNEINAWRSRYQRYYNFDSKISEEYQKFDEQIIQPLLNYRIPVIELKNTTPKEAVCQVFEKVNQGGVPLTVFELLTATYAADNYELRKDWEFIRNGSEKATEYGKARTGFKDINNLNAIDESSFLIAITLLTSYLKGGTVSCRKKDILNLTLEDYKKNRELILDGYERANQFLIEQRIFSSDYIPYGNQITPLAVICAVQKDFHNAAVKNKIAKWFWCGVLGELYGSATETRISFDVPEVDHWINHNGETPRTILESSFNTLRLFSLQSKQSAAYKGIMALLLKENCKDWIGGQTMDVTLYLDHGSDIHHIFPKDYCIKQGYSQRYWNSIVNKTPLFASTNRYIGGEAPSKYLEKIKKGKNLTVEDLKNNVSSHILDYDMLSTDNFDDFITDRAKKLLDLIENATGKKITDRGSEEVVKEFNKTLITEKEKNSM